MIIKFSFLFKRNTHALFIFFQEEEGEVSEKGKMEENVRHLADNQNSFQKT